MTYSTKLKAKMWRWRKLNFRAIDLKKWSFSMVYLIQTHPHYDRWRLLLWWRIPSTYWRIPFRLRLQAFVETVITFVFFETSAYPESISNFFQKLLHSPTQSFSDPWISPVLSLKVFGFFQISAYPESISNFFQKLLRGPSQGFWGRERHISGVYLVFGNSNFRLEYLCVIRLNFDKSLHIVVRFWVFSYISWGFWWKFPPDGLLTRPIQKIKPTQIRVKKWKD
jgi:hypothetical protein